MLFFKNKRVKLINSHWNFEHVQSWRERAKVDGVLDSLDFHQYPTSRMRNFSAARKIASRVPCSGPDPCHVHFMYYLVLSPRLFRCFITWQCTHPRSPRGDYRSGEKFRPDAQKIWLPRVCDTFWGGTVTRHRGEHGTKNTPFSKIVALSFHAPFIRPRPVCIPAQSPGSDSTVCPFWTILPLLLGGGVCSPQKILNVEALKCHLKGISGVLQQLLSRIFGNLIAFLAVSSVFRDIRVTTVFNFTRPLGVFHQKKIVFRLPSIIPYMARRQNFSCRSCKLEHIDEYWIVVKLAT